MKVGVLSLQGDVSAHVRVLQGLGADVVEVRVPADIVGLEGLVLPGGESTTMAMLLDSSGCRREIGAALSDGLPVMGTCAGMILLSREVLDGRPDQWSFSAIDLSVRRNAFGRQVDSFEGDVYIPSLDEDPIFHGVFIRAPRVERVGEGAETLGWLGSEERADRLPVLCRQGPVLVSSFHPELSGDTRVHEIFIESVRGS